MTKKMNTIDKKIYTIFDYVYAFVLTIIILAQLFTFDDFLSGFTGLGFIGGDSVAIFIGVLIVSIETFSLPFLLKMNLKPFINKISMFFGIIVLMFWLKLSVWLLGTGSVASTGLLGSVIDIPASAGLIASIGFFAAVFFTEIYFYLIKK